MTDLRNTIAYRNQFFERAGGNVPRRGVEMLIYDWFPVTQMFCQSLPGYCAHLISCSRSLSGDSRNAIETALLTPMAIATEEFGCGRHGLDGIHYRMFARLGEPLGITLEDLQRHCPGALDETRRLVETIEHAMRDVWYGAACIRIVEGTAYNIVEAMDRIFRPMTQPDGSALFTEWQLEYITLHLELEKEHDVMSEGFIESLCQTQEDHARFAKGVEQMSRLFGEYWEAMARAVYYSPSTERLTSCSSVNSSQTA